MEKQLLTHSRLQSFKTCRKQHHWAYELRLRKTTDAKALRMGSAGHEGLDILRQKKGIDAAIKEIRNMYSDRPDHIPLEEWDYERVTMECLVTGYDWYYQNDQLEVVETEMSFKIPLFNPKTRSRSSIWESAGKIDAIVKSTNGLCVFESKFISDSIDSESGYWPRLQLDTQISRYIHAARYLGYDVSSVIYDVVRKPTINPSDVPVLDEDGLKIVVDENDNRVYKPPKKAKKDEIQAKRGDPRQTASKKDGWILKTRPMTAQEWANKLMADIGERPEFYYARKEIGRIDDDIKEMQKEEWDLQKVIREAQLNNLWYKTISHNTCKYCAYFGLCSSKYELKDDQIPEGFEILDNPHPELGDSNE